MPPIEIVTRVRTRSTKPRVSIFSCFSRNVAISRPLLRRNRGERRGEHRGLLDPDLAPHRPPAVVGHDEGAGEEEDAAARPDDVEWMSGLDALDERELQEAHVVV